jgi:hypothetical protein
MENRVSKPKTYDFIKVDPDDRQLVHVNHKDCKGSFRLKKPTFGTRMEVGRIKGSMMGPYPPQELENDAEIYSIVVHGFSESPDNFDPSDICDENLMLALYQEVVLYWDLFRGEKTD